MAKTYTMTTFTIGVEMVTIPCADCSLVFAVPTAWNDKRRQDHTSFYCPNGHSLSYSSESTEERLKRERDAARREADRQRDRANAANENARHFEARANGYKGQAAKLKKRAAAGVCPFCHRTFGQMAQHIADEHAQERTAALGGDDHA